MPRITEPLHPGRRDGQIASMRPGRNAPDNHRGPLRPGADGRRFNEAGAKCPG